MLKAIETRYKGYRFRSRLEARWAVFFDAAGLDWDYEPEGFDLGTAGWYLPDFRVKAQTHFDTAWIEIKPDEPNEHEMRKLKGLDILMPRTTWVLMLCETPGKETLWSAEGIIGVDSEHLANFWSNFFGISNLAECYAAARSARFEHGESGA